MRHRLDQIHKKLSSFDTNDVELRDHLQVIMKDLEDLLDDSIETSENHLDRLLKRLQRTIDQFEVSHPEIAETIGKMAELLSRMGI